MFGSKSWHHLTALEGEGGQGGAGVCLVEVEKQETSVHTAPLLPPHLIHQHRQVACVGGFGGEVTDLYI